MDLGDVSEAGLQPIEQRVVELMYGESRTARDTAGILGIEQSAVTAALASAHRRIARWLSEIGEPAAGRGVVHGSVRFASPSPRDHRERSAS